MNNILIVEDEHLIARLIEMTLTRAGYRCTLAEDGRTAADLIETTNFDMALLDIMLPGLDGYALLECLRPQGVPVIFITAKSAVKDRVQGLRLGADDYIAKPFGVLELAARVKALLRRAGGNAALVRGNLSLDEETMTATLRGVKLELNNKEFNLLKYLMQKEGKALTRENILNAVWGYDEGETRTVDNHVARLRKLGIDYIETVFGVGYKFVYKE